MLSIKAVGGSKEAVRYYASLGESDYYLNGGEPSGTWWGEGARALGLFGKVEAKPFRNLLQGYAPDRSGPLVQNAGSEDRRSAFDLTFSVPKSVSAAWSAGDTGIRRQIELAAERALTRVLDELQDLTGYTRRGGLGERVERASLTAAIFRHDTARGIEGATPDPNLHFHVVLLNAVIREDGTSGSYDARHLFRRHMKMALGAMFRAELSLELERSVGLLSHRPESDFHSGKKTSWFELDCVPKGLLRVFSKRRVEIEKWLLKNKLHGARASERGALATRGAKEKILREELFKNWKGVAQAFGLTEASLREACVQAPSREPAYETEKAIERALSRITESAAHFSETHILRLAAEEAQCRGIGITEVREGVNRTLEEHPEIVRLEELGGERRFTTREMLSLERQILSFAERSRGRDQHSLSRSAVSRVIEDYEDRKSEEMEVPFQLRSEQREAVFHLTTSDDSVTLLNGLAGTGKTTILSACRLAWENAGLKVLGTALAAKAAKVLEDESGIASLHVHALLQELGSGKRTLDASTVVVLDEAGMVGTRQLARLVGTIERAGAKLVMVGDYRQLQAIEAGGPFRGMAARLGCADLVEITRQREAWARAAVSELAAGEASSALSRFYERGLLHIGVERDEVIETLVRDWSAATQREEDLSDTLILAGTNLEVSALNRACQTLRLTAGALGEESLLVRSDTIHAGDRVLFTRNNAALLVRNGSSGTVAAVNAESKTLMVRLDDGKTIRVHTEVFDDLKLGYVVTTHKGQGATVERAFVLASGMADRELSYVQASRARGSTRLYVDEDSLMEGGDQSALDVLARRMERSNAKDLAHDHLALREAS